MDAYLDVSYCDTSTLELLGKTSLFIAMKIEEIVPLRLEEVCYPFEARCVEPMEREMLNVLNFKLLPDTLYSWFELTVKLWDLFVDFEAAQFGCSLYKPAEQEFDPNRHVPQVFRLGSPPNKYRVAVQALDLMSLHFKMHEFARPRLALAVLALVHLNETNLQLSCPGNNLELLRWEVHTWV